MTDTNCVVVEVLTDGVPINVNATYSVTVNSFLAAGGDIFTVFSQGQNQVTQIIY